MVFLSISSIHLIASFLHPVIVSELPIRQVFVTLDGTTKSPDSFSGPIGSGLGGSASGWDVQPNFQRIPNSKFPITLNEIIDDLSTDQYYAYRMCHCVMLGTVDDDLSLLEVGLFVIQNGSHLVVGFLVTMFLRKHPVIT